jgi:hypothetical protein
MDGFILRIYAMIKESSSKKPKKVSQSKIVNSTVAVVGLVYSNRKVLIQNRIVA